jgi:hypothetical protein
VYVRHYIIVIPQACGGLVNFLSRKKYTGPGECGHLWYIQVCLDSVVWAPEGTFGAAAVAEGDVADLINVTVIGRSHNFLYSLISVSQFHKFTKGELSLPTPYLRRLPLICLNVTMLAR